MPRGAATSPSATKLSYGRISVSSWTDAVVFRENRTDSSSTESNIKPHAVLNHCHFYYQSFRGLQATPQLLAAKPNKRMEVFFELRIFFKHQVLLVFEKEIKNRHVA